MENDLISRSVLLNKMREHTKKQRYLISEEIWDAVENAPAAYDVDKVVELLDDYLFEKYCIEGDNEVERIIKSGGIE